MDNNKNRRRSFPYTLPCITFLKLLLFTENIGPYRKIVSGSCSSNGMQPITSLQECNIAAEAIGNRDITATKTDSSSRPEGCYDNGNLWLAINPVNKGNGPYESLHPICKTTG